MGPRKSRRSSQSFENNASDPPTGTDNVSDVSRGDTDLSSLTRCDTVLSHGVARTLTRKQKRTVSSLDAKIEACNAKLHRLNVKLEEDYAGVAMDSSSAVRKLNTIIQKTKRQLAKLKMAQYAARQTS